MQPDSKPCPCNRWPPHPACGPTIGSDSLNGYYQPPLGGVTGPNSADVAAVESQMRAAAAFNRAGRLAALPSAAERLKHLRPQQQEAASDAYQRRHAVSLAVKASDGSNDDLRALAVMFADLKRAEDARRHLEELAAHLMAEMKEATNG